MLGVFEGQKAELVVSDGAPDVTGLHEIDQYLQAQLLHAALIFTCSMLKPEGHFVAKFFKSSDLSYLFVMMKQAFRNVYVVKPQSSRASSAEAFVVGLGFLGQDKAGGLGALSDSIKAIKPVSSASAEEEKEEEDDKLTF